MRMSQLRFLPNKDGIKKKEVCRLCHEYLLNELHEEDEPDIACASVFKDLYDCHVCVEHIGQTYVKGIVKGRNDTIFGLEDELTFFELSEIEERVLYKEKRFTVNNIMSTISAISTSDLENLGDYVLLDVRSEGAFINKPRTNAINLPLSKLSINPFLVGVDKWANYVFCCESGSEAQIAAEFAINAGYKNIFVLTSNLE